MMNFGEFVAAFVLGVLVMSGGSRLSNLREYDVKRTEETLSLRGFSHIEIGKTSITAGNDACAKQADTCTEFTAVAPWGWKVAGAVACPDTGTCRVMVNFE